MNICVTCKFCVREDVGSPREDDDYNISCSASDKDMVPCQDPVLGVKGYSRTNDLGGFIFCSSIAKARPSCRSQNPMGECKKYERDS